MSVRKSDEQNLNEMLQDMKANTPITQTAPGGTARAVLEIFNQRLSTTYDYIDDKMMMAYVSTATGIYLDMIGELLDCTRLPNETDGNYRYRITQKVYVAAKSNETALKALCLQVDGVNDVIFTPYTHGMGSFTVHVISDELDTPIQLINQVQSILDENQAAGVRGIAAKPILIPVDVIIRTVVTSGVTQQEASSIAYDIKTKVESYIKELGMGSPIRSMDIYQIAYRARVAEVSIENIKINDREISGSPSEYAIQWDARYYPRDVKVIV